jgi:hypothetical protein
MATLMFLDEVLRSHTNTPIPQGIALFRTLNEKGRVIILSTFRERDEIWLRQHKINLIDDIIGPDVLTFMDEPEWRLVEYCRGHGPVDMVITANPQLATKLLSVGITTVMFLHPVYITEKFRPDSRQGVKSWEGIAKEIADQQSYFVNDHRVN